MYPRKRLVAALMASFISATVARFSTWATRSTMETLGVGTRTARPSNLPVSSGMTLLTAAAAPVLVGIMLTAAALARLRSLWGKSSNL